MSSMVGVAKKSISVTAVGSSSLCISVSSIIEHRVGSSSNVTGLKISGSSNFGADESSAFGAE
jgi:hypothetical protein